ncbi:hypothetical protein SLE2022_127790 [Rubroshorea leprosula]
MAVMGRRRRLAVADLVAAAAFWVLIVVQVDLTVQLRRRHPMHEIVDGVNDNAGPYIGLVMAYPTEEMALLTSGLFLPNPDVSSVDLAGRTFNIGKIKGVDVIYVMTGEQTINAATAVQTLLDAFDIRGIVHYGIAGSTNNSLSYGDVSIMNYVALTASWKWKEFKSEEGSLPTLEFGDFNFPKKGENLLALVEFTPVQLFSTGKPMQEVFWLPVDSHWFSIAAQLQGLKLEQCINETYCLPETPKVVYGLKGSSADVYLDNEAYRDFLFKQLNVSTVDEETAAVIMTCLTNAVPCIAFRGVSDMAGGKGRALSGSLSSLASANALIVAVAFMGLIPKEGSVYIQ